MQIIKTIREVVAGVRALPQVARIAMLDVRALENRAEHTREWLAKLDEERAAHFKTAESLEHANRQIADVVFAAEQSGWNGVENPKLLHLFVFDLADKLSAAESERDELRRKLDWLLRWRRQEDEPCPFPISEEVLMSTKQWATCLDQIARLNQDDLWRPLDLTHYEPRDVNDDPKGDDDGSG